MPRLIDQDISRSEQSPKQKAFGCEHDREQRVALPVDEELAISRKRELERQIEEQLRLIETFKNEKFELRQLQEEEDHLAPLSRINEGVRKSIKPAKAAEENSERMRKAIEEGEEIREELRAIKRGDYQDAGSF
jgi:hypothetical protein